MNGLELGAALSKYTVPQLRKIFCAAAKELGWTPKYLAQRLEDMGYGPQLDNPPFSWTHSAIWFLRCEKRIFTPTGKMLSYCSDNTFGTMRKYKETTCSWVESDASMARALAAAEEQ